uniref:Uncharacterized protein n=1 Tax=Glossina pallidipes TaxID=7398 RepID=A0A1B0ABH5_GLOPL
MDKRVIDGITYFKYEFSLVVIVVESSRGCGGNGIDSGGGGGGGGCVFGGDVNSCGSKLNSENSNSIQMLAKTIKHYLTSNSKPKGRQCAKRVYLKLIDMRMYLGYASCCHSNFYSTLSFDFVDLCKKLFT